MPAVVTVTALQQAPTHDNHTSPAGTGAASDSAREPGRDLLQDPAVALGVVERGVRHVRAALRVVPGGASLVADVEAAAEATSGVVKHTSLTFTPCEISSLRALSMSSTTSRSRLRSGDLGAEDD